MDTADKGALASAARPDHVLKDVRCLQEEVTACIGQLEPAMRNSLGTPPLSTQPSALRLLPPQGGRRTHWPTRAPRRGGRHHAGAILSDSFA
jgi:hypothetical protein